jgi:hypothetical protein
MNKQMLIFPLVEAMISIIVFAPLESASAQNASVGNHACISGGPMTGTNMTNATMGGNATDDYLSNSLLDKKSG